MEVEPVQFKVVSLQCHRLAKNSFLSSPTLAFPLSLLTFSLCSCCFLQGCSIHCAGAGSWGIWNSGYSFLLLCLFFSCGFGKIVCSLYAPFHLVGIKQTRYAPCFHLDEVCLPILHLREAEIVLLGGLGALKPLQSFEDISARTHYERPYISINNIVLWWGPLHSFLSFLINHTNFRYQHIEQIQKLCAPLTTKDLYIFTCH